MKYSEWNALSNEERKNTNWHQRPHIRTGTLFTIAITITIIIVVLGISKNSTVHLNRNPTAKEAFAIAKLLVKDKLKQPDKALFQETFKTDIDTATNAYHISSVVKIENNGGKMESSNWEINMNYTGGDWSERNSWHINSVNINP